MRILKIGSAVLVGLLSWAVIFHRPVATAMMSKAIGGNQPCPWARLLRYPWEEQRFAEFQRAALDEVSVAREDLQLGIQLIRTSGRAFWIKKEGHEMTGKALLAYVLAEQKWVIENDPQHSVKPGNIVVDVGAHIGTFDDDALRRGASKCILVEPDPVNVECIRRNFSTEIAQGRVIVVPEGAWSSRSVLNFAIGVANSGTGSFVLHESGAKTISVPVRKLDEILADLNVGHVDYIKMDIEGAEREALKGANETLRRWKPVLMIDSYHLSDDDVVLPHVIGAAKVNYHTACAACSPDRLGSQNRFVPYIVFYN